ncbi:branched-chain amino acid ABC transporter permease [Bradyrhizobium sp.]|uniref:branched-chain amino acid ABC transporter permease n=1 Tax=Bradyrhizobium sp. TaxID=376 RepID=UPI0039E3EB1E
MRQFAAPRAKRDLRSSCVYLLSLPLLPFVLPSLPLATEIVIMTIASLSCYLVLAYGPLLSFGQGAFFGIGAYVGAGYALRAKGTVAGDVVFALPISAMAAAVAALCVGSVALRRVAGGDGSGAGGLRFLMLTFAVAQVAYFCAYNLPQLTGGENGLLDVPRLPAFAIRWFTTPGGFYVVCAAVLAVLVVGMEIAANSVIGLGFKAVTESEHRAAAVGYRVFWMRLALFTTAGAIAGIAGCLYASFLGLVPLSAIDVRQSESIVVATILGGVGAPLGPLLGTICLTLGGDLFSKVWPHWPFAVGAIIVLVVFFARGGLWGLIERATAIRIIRAGHKATAP